MFRFWMLLVIVALGCVALYECMPRKVGALELKKIDLLSDLRVDSTTNKLDQVDASSDFIKNRKQTKVAKATKGSADSVVSKVQKRDSLYIALQKQGELAADSTLVAFEDYSAEHNGLNRFFKAIFQRGSLNRPVRIAVLGDSFIEGDIFTQDVRRQLQSRFGGSGVGWMPLSSETSGFRQSVKHSFGGWTDRNILHHSKGAYTISGHSYLLNAETAWAQYVLPVDSAVAPNLFTVYYTPSKDAEIFMKAGDSTMTKSVIGSEHVLQAFSINTKSRQLRVTVKSRAGFSVQGVAMEGVPGISVDNYSLRGNSGLLLNGLNIPLNQTYSSLRKYDLIVLQYGLNVASSKQSNYSNYVRGMKSAIARLKQCYPDSDILLMGVTDRAEKVNGAFVSSRGVLALAAAQQQLARDAGVVFWNSLAGMGGEGSMTRMVEKGWAAKDYTHLSFKGGRFVAGAFMKAFENEYKYYEAKRKANL